MHVPITDEEALLYDSYPRGGKILILPTTSFLTQRDMSTDIYIQKEAFKDVMMVIGLCKPENFTVDEVKLMAKDPIVFTLVNPTPEIYDTKLVFGRDYIIQKSFDERLIVEVSSAVAQSAVESGMSDKKDFYLDAYRAELSARI